MSGSDSDQKLGSLHLDGTKIHSDTSPAIERRMIELVRTMTPSQKMAKVNDLILFARNAALAQVRLRYPDETDWEWQLRVASRYIPADLMLKAYGWDVHEKGY